MISGATKQFWQAYDVLPSGIQGQAKTKYAIWLKDPHHPSLHFKPLQGSQKLWSVRINRNHRALGYFETPSHFVWVWIGNHDQYDRLVRSR